MPQSIPLDQIKDVICAWGGCELTCAIGVTPEDWVSLITWHDRKGDGNRTINEIVTREPYGLDIVLCPNHFSALTQCLKAYAQ